MFTVQFKNPSQESIITLNGQTDFTYIMRKDGPFVADAIARRMSQRTGMNGHLIASAVGHYYDAFNARLVDILGHYFSFEKGKVEIHLYDSEPLERIVKEKAHGKRVVNIDPLLNGQLPSLSTSRHYALSGIHTLSQGERPGTDPILRQIEHLANLHGDRPAVIVEDDIFSGNSMIEVVSKLRAHGITCSHVCPGIQIGESKKLSDMRVSVDPAVRYVSTSDRDVFDQVDLGDARDFLLGASGLVVVLPDKSYGRAPYVLPFVSPHARAGIAPELELAFSREVLLANRDFFSSVERILARPLTLADVDPSFERMCRNLYGIQGNSTMRTVVDWTLDRTESLAQVTRRIGDLQLTLHGLNLPSRMVFLDLNGTLLPEGAKSCALPEDVVKRLRQQISRLSRNGIAVGLCSDSPLNPLREFIAEPLGMTGPIIAENGNLIWNEGREARLRGLPQSAALRQQIAALVRSISPTYTQKPDALSVEFGQPALRFDRNEWSFGAGRESSISVFAPRELIERIASGISLPSDLTMDVSPDHNYLAIHPGQFRTNKGEALGALSAFGYDVQMIGNSVSDWVSPKTGVRCSFVADSTVSREIVESAAFRATKPTVEGVIEILEAL